MGRNMSSLWSLPLRGLRLRQSGPQNHRFSEEDLSLLWEAIFNMFEHDHSAARGKWLSGPDRIQA